VSSEPTYNDKLKFLVSRRFPTWSPGEPQFEAEHRAIENYEASLSQLSQSEIEELYLEAVNEYETERIKAEVHADRLEWFNQAQAGADYPFWCKLDTWSLEEAAALLLGKHPGQINSTTIGPIRHGSPFRWAFIDLHGKLLRTHADGKLKERDSPNNFVTWAQTVGAHVPEQLLKYLDTPRAAPIENRERTSMLTMIIGMATKHYGYDVSDAKSDVPGRIVKDLENLGLELGPAPVRKYLREAAPLLRDSANKKESS